MSDQEMEIDEEFEDEYKVSAMVFVNATQQFELAAEASDLGEAAIKQAFEAIEMTLDPAPPCTWSIADLRVESVEIDGAEVTRVYSATVEISCKTEDFEALKSYMEEEGYYDSDDEEFDWMSAVNYIIADTTAGPDYSEFVQESVDLDVIEMG